ncbi:TKL protein kinase [Fonticula alba]|uniref:TKL protein kinase n=1 Tax=Fonticula alba TaxID=691883 RepID=A0A058Z0L7_FONAL|nr:TKL protein kinase [Fonticula alba]KCV67814.1 TKL protein kinase [Fonticula alba]|eukprot:XP_009497845.1 TKL protein kinase [Fonticula alba]
MALPRCKASARSLSWTLALLLLLLSVCMPCGPGAVGAQLAEQIGGSLFWMQSPGDIYPRSEGHVGRLVSGQPSMWYTVTPSRWRASRHQIDLDTFKDIRHGFFFPRTSENPLTGDMSGVPASPTRGPLALPSSRWDPLFLWQHGSQIILSTTGQSYPYSGLNGMQVTLLAGQAIGVHEATALVLLGSGTTATARTLSWLGGDWSAQSHAVSQPVGLGVSGLPGSFLLATTTGWSCLRPGKAPVVRSLNERPTSLVATRFLTSDPGLMDLVVVTASRLRVYIGLSPVTCVAVDVLESSALPADRRPLTTHFVPAIQDMSRPTGFLLLGRGVDALWRVSYLPGPNGPADGQFIWQPFLLNYASFFDPQSNYPPNIASLNLGSRWQEHWVYTYGRQTFLLREQFACKTDASIECSGQKPSWRCAPGRRLAPLRSPLELCAGCIDGLYPVHLGLGRYDCRPCSVPGCRVCSDGGGSCTSCHRGLLLWRDPAGGADTCTAGCPDGSRASGQVCVASAHVPMDIDITPLSHRPEGAYAVTTCPTRTYLRSGRLHVSKASLTAAEPGALLAGMSSGAVSMLNVDALRQDPASMLDHVPVSNLPNFSGVRQIIELDPSIRQGNVQINIVVIASRVHHLALSCTLPDVGPHAECEVDIVSKELAGLAATTPARKVAPSVVAFDGHVVDFQEAEQQPVSRALSEGRSKHPAMVMHRDPATGHSDDWIYQYDHRYWGLYACPWKLFRQGDARCQLEDPRFLLYNAVSMSAPPSGEGIHPLRGSEGVSAVDVKPDRSWVLISLATGSRSPHLPSEDVVHAGTLHEGGRFFWAAEHVRLGLQAQGRTRDIAGMGMVLAELPNYNFGNFAMWGVTLHGVVGYPSALVVVFNQMVGVSLMHCPVGGLGQCRLEPGRISSFHPSVGFSSPQQVLVAPAPGTWTMHEGRPAAVTLLLFERGPKARHGLLVRVGLGACPAGTFGPSCIPCDARCQTCSGPGPGGCIVPRCGAFMPSDPTTCLAACPAGLHAGADGSCRCHEQCAACGRTAHDSFVCNVCPPGMALDRAQPQGDRCFACHPSCGECSTPASASGCLSCSGPGMLLRPDGTCGSSCPAGTWADAHTGTCDPCMPNCATCTGPSSCGTCQGGYLLEPISGWCIACADQCARCSGRLDAFLECRTGYRWLSGAPPSEAGTPGTCVACPRGCADCHGNGQCVSCESNHIFQASTRSCVYVSPPGCDTFKANGLCDRCMMGFYLDASANECRSSCPAGMSADAERATCQPCHASCAECKAPGDPGACTSCAGGRALQPDGRTCADTCPRGFLREGAACRACGSKCLACSRAGECDECQPGHYSSSAGACLPCHGSCATCTQASACDTCHLGLVFLSSDPAMPSLCGSVCPAGERPGADRCTGCDESCTVCASARGDLCEVCAPGYRWEGDPPPAGGSKVCVACGQGCLSCTARKCFRCTSGWFLGPGSVCVAACPAGMYGDLVEHACRPCDVSCATCSGPWAQQCTSCAANLEHLPAGGRPDGRGSCRSLCPEGEFREMPSGVCQPCDPACAACNGPTDGDCWRCRGGLLQGGACVQACAAGHVAMSERCLACHVSCAECSGVRFDQCLGACPAGLLAFPAGASPKQCVPSCPGNFFASDAGCTACPADCQYCPAGPDTCSRCSRSKLLSKGACVSVCPAGSLDDRVQCYTCDGSCATCHGPGPQHCLACVASAPLVWDSTCHVSCPRGTFRRDAECVRCFDTCETCSGPGPGDCTSCPVGRVLGMDGACFGDCPPGQYAGVVRGGQPACHPCSATCDQCLGPGAAECTACRPGQLLEDGRCVGRCSAGYFECAADAGRCRACPAGCTECMHDRYRGPGCEAACGACAAGWVLSPRTGVCESACPAGEYLPGPGESHCAPCAGACTTCHHRADRCTGCADVDLWLWVDSGRCAGSCPAQGYAPLARDGVCLPCVDGCEYCSASDEHPGCQWPATGGLSCPRADRCDACASGLLLLRGAECVESCPVGFYADWEAPRPLCAACHVGCTYACVGPSEEECIHPGGGAARMRLVLGLGIGLGMLLVLLALLALGLLLRRRSRSKAPAQAPPDEDSTVLNTIVEMSLPGAMLVSMTHDVVALDEDHLGSGAQAAVFAARVVGAGTSSRLGCMDTVAIKQMKADRMTPLQVTLLQNEIALMWLLREHAHIVRIYGYSEDPPAIVMERFEGDLAGLLHSDLWLGLGALLDLGLQWATGLEAMHANGIAHCDLKPGNVFVRRGADGARWYAALGDLGTSRNLNADRASALVTAAPELNALTARYAAPEVLQAFQRRHALRAEHYLPSDMYSAGILLWETISRRVPWEGLRFGGIAGAVAAGDRPALYHATDPVAQEDSALGRGLADELSRLWSEDPVNRSSASHLRHLLAELAATLA